MQYDKIAAAIEYLNWACSTTCHSRDAGEKAPKEKKSRRDKTSCYESEEKNRRRLRLKGGRGMPPVVIFILTHRTA